ncbi:MAG: urease accessory protein UreE [Deltaproteobacteria bacterium]|nr:urease accessory protein UreE [Deltaproteobacteria bacterium]
MGTSLKIHTILGLAHEDSLAQPLHALAHRDAIETIRLSSEDMHRRRLRATTDQGTECAIVLPRTRQLEDGAVLWLDKERAVLVRMKESSWLLFEPRDTAAALALGYLAGNMHWQVELTKGIMRVGVNGNRDATLKRVAPLVVSGKVRQIHHA